MITIVPLKDSGISSPAGKIEGFVQTQSLPESQIGECPHFFHILHEKQSEAAHVLYASRPSKKPSIHRRVVIKILKPYQDLRYQLATTEERQQCQIEALKQNRLYSPDIYMGLARVYELSLENKAVILGEIIEQPQQSDLDKNAEYALVMRWLPQSRRLDTLLERQSRAKKSRGSLLRYMELLSETIARAHEVDEQNIPSLCRPRWGSPEQLQRKLNHNLPFLESVLKIARDGQLSEYEYLKETFAQLNKLMLRALQHEEFHGYFKQRMEQQRILRCHGDLKAANIWILAAKGRYGEMIGERVKMLDAIDFNDSYCTIDILADMAMLAVDIEARSSREVAQHFIRSYLATTQQEDAMAKAVLTYYLVEKAMIGAIVNYVYDNQPELGMRYVQVARHYMTQLQQYEFLLWCKSLPKRTMHSLKAFSKKGAA